MKFLKESGFSMVELMIGVAIIGVVAVGTGQLLKHSSTESAKFSNKIELKSLMNIISQEYSKSDVCTAQFKDKPIIHHYVLPSGLYSGSKLLLKQGMRVANERYRVEQIETLNLDVSRFKLKITFKDLRAIPGAQDIVTESIAISADVDNENLIIKNCYEGGTPLDPTGANVDACRGPGIIQQSDGSCLVKNFNVSNCDEGQGFGFILNSSTGHYEVSCVSPMEASSDCPQGLIQNYDASGNIVCASLSNSVADMPLVTIANSAACALRVENGKLKLDCSGGGPSCTCPDPATMCIGETFIGCNGDCTVTGTRTGMGCCFSSCHTAGYDCLYGSPVVGADQIRTCSGATQYCAHSNLNVVTPVLCIAPENSPIYCKYRAGSYSQIASCYPDNSIIRDGLCDSGCSPRPAGYPADCDQTTIFIGCGP